MSQGLPSPLPRGMWEKTSSLGDTEALSQRAQPSPPPGLVVPLLCECAIQMPPVHGPCPQSPSAATGPNVKRGYQRPFQWEVAGGAPIFAGGWGSAVKPRRAVASHHETRGSPAACCHY